MSIDTQVKKAQALVSVVADDFDRLDEADEIASSLLRAIGTPSFEDIYAEEFYRAMSMIPSLTFIPPRGAADAVARLESIAVIGD